VQSPVFIPTLSLTAGCLIYRRRHTTADHQSSAFHVAGPRQPRLSTPHSHASRKDIRSDGDRASPLGSTSNSSRPSSIAVVAHDQATMSIPSRPFTVILFMLCPRRHNTITQRALFFALFFPEGLPVLRVLRLFIYFFSSYDPCRRGCRRGYTDMLNGE
jgi:hypothetical protein